MKDCTSAGMLESGANGRRKSSGSTPVSTGVHSRMGRTLPSRLASAAKRRRQKTRGRKIVAGECAGAHPDAGDTGERAVTALELSQDRAGDGAARIARGAHAAPDYDEALGIRVGERMQQHAVKHAEDRGGDADAERERDERDGGEGLAPPEGAPGVADVLEKGADAGPGGAIAHLFLDLLHTFKVDAGGAAGLAGRQSRGQVPVDYHLEAGAQLFFEIILQPAAAKQIVERVGDAAKHVRYPSDSSIQFMADVMRYQLRFSSARRPRPLRVSL